MASTDVIGPGSMTRLFTAAFAMLFSSRRSARADTLTLHDAIDLALRFAPSLEMATATSDLSEARTREMRAPMMPVDFGGLGILPGARLRRGHHQSRLDQRAARARLHRRRFRTPDVAAARRALCRRGRQARHRRRPRANCVRCYRGVLRSDAGQARVIETQANVDRLSRYVDTVDQLQRSGRAIENDTLKGRTTRDAAELTLSDARNDQLRAAANSFDDR